MTLNPIKWWKNRKKVTGPNGLQSSGHMNDSERSAAFHRSKKLPQ